MTGRKLRAIFFDAGGTLIRPYPSVGAIYASVAERHGIHRTADEMERAFRQSWAALKEPGLTVLRKEWWRQLVFRVLGQENEPCFEALFEEFARPESWQVFPDVEATLREAHARGLHVGVISNWDNRLRELLNGLSLLQHFDSLAIENGGQVYSPGEVRIGSQGGPGSNNTLIVSGSNSVLSPGSVEIDGQGSQLIVTNGARVSNTPSPTISAGCTLTIVDGGQFTCGAGPCRLSGSIIVTGTGSIFTTTKSGLGTYGGSANVTISNGGQMIINTGCYNTYNQFTVAEGGMLTVTGGPMTVQSGVLTISGSATLDTLALDGTFNFPRGLLEASTILATNGFVFTVGDGTNAATLKSEGGVYTFSSGCHVSPNSFLTGCGTINGNVIVDPGATILTTCGGTLTIIGTVTNNGLLRATNGSMLESYGTVVNNGLIDIMTGTTNFHSTFINNGTVVDGSYFRVTSIAPQSNGVNVIWTTVGGRSNVVQVSVGGTGYSGTFTDLSSVIAVPGAGLGTTNYIDAGALTNASSRFYRVRLVP